LAFQSTRILIIIMVGRVITTVIRSKVHRHFQHLMTGPPAIPMAKMVTTTVVVGITIIRLVWMMHCLLDPKILFRLRSRSFRPVNSRFYCLSFGCIGTYGPTHGGGRRII